MLTFFKNAKVFKRKDRRLSKKTAVLILIRKSLTSLPKYR